MAEALAFWNDTPTKQLILKYVSMVTDPQKESFIPPIDRIVIFDNDGTLWIEKPTYIQGFFAIIRLQQIAKSKPELLEKPQYKAAVKGDLEFFSKIISLQSSENDMKPLLSLIYDSHADMPQDEFTQMAKTFLEKEKHPRFGKPFKELTYKPMVELIHFLAANEFKVFIASAGGMSFVRSVSEEIYDLPRERVIGSNIAFETKMMADGPVIIRKQGLIDPIDDGLGKPVNIELHIGRKPIIAAGNSDGDIPMLWLAQKSGYRSLSLLIQHDDAEREYAYTMGTEKLNEVPPERGWIKVSMKNDWKTIF
jgi:phosphoserine phosphatase